MAQAIVAKSNALGGSMTLDDLASYKGEWVTAARSDYHGYTLNELPPPSQDWGANLMLNVLEACVPKWAKGETLASLGPRSPKYWHLLVEAKKLAYADLYRYNADPNFVQVPIEMLLSKMHAESLCASVDPDRAASTRSGFARRRRRRHHRGSTAVPTATSVSVKSNFGFGSGITVPGYDFILHIRVALFSPKSPNVISHRCCLYNTLSAGFVMKGGSPLMTLLLMGGDMQAQGHAQTVKNIKVARFHHLQLANQLYQDKHINGA